MINLYRRLVRSQLTVNQLNNIHINLANRMTPLELEGLQSELPTAPSVWQNLIYKSSRKLPFKLPESYCIWQQKIEYAKSARDWIDMLHRACLQSGKAAPEPFIRRRLRQVALFSAGENRSGKILAICFAGNAQRMMMPMPVFLQHLDSSRVDVAFVKDPKRKGFRKGIDGIAPNLDILIKELKSLLKTEEYLKVVTIGTSGGGLPAILTAVKLGLDAGMSVGGRGPDAPIWLTNDSKMAGELLISYAKQSSAEPRLFLVYGNDKPKDKAKAEALADVVNAQLIPVSDPSGPVGHNALYPLVNQGKLTKFLEATVFDLT